MKTGTASGKEIDLPPELLNTWKTRLRGPVLTPGDAGYEDSRTVVEQQDRPEAVADSSRSPAACINAPAGNPGR